MFQYAEGAGATMPTAYENLWNRVAPFVVGGTGQPTGGQVFRCPSDRFLAKQAPWGEANQCSYAPNADETGAGTLKPEDEAGLSVTIGANIVGASHSPFGVRFKGGTEECVMRLNSVATDTILLAECWRKNTQNSLFLDRPALRMRETQGVPVVGSRNGLLLKQYTSTAGPTASAKSRINDAGPFNFLIEFADGRTTFDGMYHRGLMNVVFADGHVEAKSVKDLAVGPAEYPWKQPPPAGSASAGPRKEADIPYWNRFED